MRKLKIKHSQKEAGCGRNKNPPLSPEFRWLLSVIFLLAVQRPSALRVELAISAA